MPLLPEFPISGDDYTNGTITTIAGKKEFVTKDAYLNSFGGVRPGDHIYISTVGKILIIGSITGDNSGTLTDPCPDDCAVKDLPLRVMQKTASSRVQGRISMLLEKLSKGVLAAFSEITAKENQIFQATNVDGEIRAIDLNADNVAETNKRKFMTDDERLKLGKVKTDLTATDIAETDDRKFMTDDEREDISGTKDTVKTISEGLDIEQWRAGDIKTNTGISPSVMKDLKLVGGVGSYVSSGSARLPVLGTSAFIQVGVTEIGSNIDVVFPTAFPNACIGVFPSAANTSAVWDTALLAISVSAITKSGCRLHARAAVNGGVVITQLNSLSYLAVGY